jgi:hypothetical protein
MMSQNPLFCCAIGYVRHPEPPETLESLQDLLRLASNRLCLASNRREGVFYSAHRLGSTCPMPSFSWLAEIEF